MTAPKWAAYVYGARRYRNPGKFDGEYAFLSITHVVGALHKELTWWAAGLTAEEVLDRPQNWSSKPRQAAYQYLRSLHHQVMRAAGERGTAVHEAIEAAMQGKDISDLAKTDPYVNGALKYLNEVKPQPLVTEASVYSDSLQVAGTLDFNGTLGAYPETGICTVDYKTGNNIWPDHAIQLAGYGPIAEYRLDDDGKEHEWQPPQTNLIVHIQPDSYSVHPVLVEEPERRAFLACLELRRWQDRKPIGKALETSWLYEWVCQKIDAMDYTQQLELSNLFQKVGLETTLSTLSESDLAIAASLIRQLDDFTQPRKEESEDV